MVSLPAETEVEYELVTVTVTSPLPETTVLPFAAGSDVERGNGRILHHHTRGRAVDIHSDGGVARRACAGAGRRVVRERRRVGVEIKFSVLQHHIGGRVGEVEHRP